MRVGQWALAAKICGFACEYGRGWPSRAGYRRRPGRPRRGPCCKLAVDGQKGDGDIAEGFHLRDPAGVAGDIDTNQADFNNESEPFIRAWVVGIVRRHAGY